ncbi:Formate--tetrahydrofolate ligase [Caldalkalibacillus thermarum TA2.A1]|uniref:Formate--tetrahydrofolate ligase n=1 Tax=Caldalkalibacillus thermarum (strain TA2.A1) TaxID=986075 RepID=F5L5P0_CALTT|nr:formate--tetrahydrofolate ligase [Caldalkalibacillus thermarum]EGL83357.1 Formate--tetrahydrofolate ligase [Caldalkalibacillus thermarum TA2.A1]QZT34895.1 formate--tetrahydrofolate ligase [Caldalkalibacillus thermarum TA2.A1]
MQTPTIVQDDITIAQQAKLKPIGDIAALLGLKEDDYEPYGHYKAKVKLDVLKRLKTKQDGKLILVTGISPTPAGEGKSTVTVGLGQALNRLGRKAVVALREPSLGPTMGIKGGATGGGYSQVLPMEDINLHFTGDIHAITAANNALSALIDNHIHQGNQLGIDPRRIIWKRVLDMNDRALRQVVVGLGGPAQGVPRQDGFDITVASEVMAVLCLSEDIEDLKQRLSRMVIGYTYDKQPVTVADLKAQGAMALLLKDALKPNLVQTLENTPAFIHGGPFANIAHGCNSLVATKMALKLAEYTVTEAGFGADLGAEKFINIKSRAGGLKPDAAVIVATVRALKMHGGVPKDQLKAENVEAVKKGLENLAQHVHIMHHFRLPCVVALNHFLHDTETELKVIEQWCEEQGVPFTVCRVWAEGGRGGEALAETVIKLVEGQQTGKENKNPAADESLRFTYPLEASIADKIRAIATNIYGARDVQFSPKAQKQMEQFEMYGWGKLPICMAKTQYSFSDAPNRLGRPTGFTLTIRELKPSIGAGFIVALTGDVMTMPGLPKEPAALKMNIDNEGKVEGLF